MMKKNTSNKLISIPELPNELKIVEEESVHHFFHVASFFFCGATCSSVTHDEDGFARYVEFVEFLLRRDVIGIERDVFCWLSVAYEFFHAPGIGHNGYLLYGYDIPAFYLFGGFALCSVEGDFAVTTCIGGLAATFVYSYGPQPFVYSGIFAHDFQIYLCLCRLNTVQI